ncbi:MAG: helix-turn-helix transcriptional regulator [Bergeyella sp.]|nr:helix-turn-helix transcriptional regulator [Bergeyella sp.]
MILGDGFIYRRPNDLFLSTIVDSYFYIDTNLGRLTFHPEYVVPFPQITFGYFFNHPFLVTHLNTNNAVTVNIVVSRISTQKIIIQPTTKRIRIIGAHLKPFGLAYFTRQPVNRLPWLIDAEELFGNVAEKFAKRINDCQKAEQMFSEVEKVFLDNILIRDLSLITEVTGLIEKNVGNIKISELSRQLGVLERTIRNHFYNHIGCSPKEYLRIVKLKQVVYELKHSQKSLTHIAHDNDYFDQAHFIHEIKGITGRSPNQLRKEIPTFRFLQF